MARPEPTEPRPVARVYEPFRSYLPTFLANRAKDLVELRQALELNDFPTLARRGHSLAGTCGTFGFSDMMEVGRALEGAAQAGDRDALPQLVAEFARQLDETEIVFIPMG